MCKIRCLVSAGPDKIEILHIHQISKCQMLQIESRKARSSFSFGRLILLLFLMSIVGVARSRIRIRSRTIFDCRHCRLRCWRCFCRLLLLKCRLESVHASSGQTRSIIEPNDGSSVACLCSQECVVLPPSCIMYKCARKPKHFTRHFPPHHR